MKTDRFQHTFSVSDDGKTAKFNRGCGSGNYPTVNVEARTEHFIVVREKGANFWAGSGNQSWMPGKIRVVEIKKTGRAGYYHAANHATWEQDSDRAWRTTVKAATVAMHGAEFDWEAFNATREARFAAEEAAIAEGDRVQDKCKYLENHFTAEIADTVRFWVQDAQDKARKEGVEVTKDDAQRVVARAVARCF